MKQNCLCYKCILDGLSNCPKANAEDELLKLKRALREISKLDLGGPDCENHKHWQAHQFHEARKIALNALKSYNKSLKPT